MLQKTRVFLLLVLACLAPSSAMAVEEPGFKMLLKDHDYEVRAYPKLIAAEVHVSGTRDAAVNKGFQLLADYIFGNNRSKAKVAMTAPVTQSATAGTRIAMTAPVTQSSSDRGWTIRFIMPSAYTLDTLPEPNNPEVILIPLPETEYAVIRFSGLASEKETEAKTAGLYAWLTNKGYIAIGAPTLARYDPPWTPRVMRRNEVMVPIAAGAS